MTMIRTGLSGLNVAQAGLAAVSHNIANVNTPGYSRQITQQSTNLPQFTGAGYLGQGAHLDTVERAYNQFLDMQAREAQTQTSYFDTLSAQLASVDQMFSDATAGVSPALTDYFKSIGSTAANPADGAARQTMVASGEALANRFRDVSSRLESLRGGLNEQVRTSVEAINAAAGQIAELNHQLVLAAGRGGQPPNDLLDQRDFLLREIGGEIRISVSDMGNGALGVSLSNGQPLVLDSMAFPVSAQLSAVDGANLTVGDARSGVFLPFGESLLSGGRLGGVLAFRSQVLDIAQNSLGRVAGALATAQNAQHALGQDRNGARGGALFSFDGARVLPDTRNAGSGVLTAAVASYDAVTTSDYQVDFDGSNYRVTRLADKNQQVFASLPQSIDGFVLTLASGTPAIGDSFKVMPTRAAAASLAALISDPARIAAALPVRASANAANAGAAGLRVDAVTPPAGTNLTQPVTITFTGPTTFNVSGTGTGNPVGLTYAPGMTVSYNGWNATLQGKPATGDVFSVGANTNGSGDNGNLLALSALGDARLIGNGTLSAGEAYAQVVSSVGNQARTAASSAKAQAIVLAEAKSAQQEVSGVNLDEEAANLLKYQQAYQAASRVIAIANTLFSDILSIMR